MQPHVSDVDAVNKDGTPSRLHQSEQRQSQGRFACPCPAHNAHLVTSDKKPTSKSFLPFLFPLRPTNPHTAPLLSSVPIGTVKTQRLSSPLYLQVQYKHSASLRLCIYRYSTNTAPLLCICRYSTNTAPLLCICRYSTNTAPLLCIYRYSTNTAPLLCIYWYSTNTAPLLSSPLYL